MTSFRYYIWLNLYLCIYFRGIMKHISPVRYCTPTCQVIKTTWLLYEGKQYYGARLDLQSYDDQPQFNRSILMMQSKGFVSMNVLLTQARASNELHRCQTITFYYFLGLKTIIEMTAHEWAFYHHAICINMIEIWSNNPRWKYTANLVNSKK